MAAYILAANGNASSAAVWGLVSAIGFLNSEAGSTVLTTSYVEGVAFTPGAITIDGIAVKVARRVAAPSGTISVRLAQAGALVAGTEVTLNVSDIVYGVGIAADAPQNGWLLFKFAAPKLLLAATAYTVSAKTSVAAQVHLWRDATAGNWSRMLRTTTFAALIAGDTFHVLGEWTAAATVTARTVTWDITAATDFGDASTTVASVTIGAGGTMTWGTVAATNYLMRVSGLVDVCAGGVLSMGTTAVPCPRDSSQQLEFDCAADGDFGLRVYGTWNGQGQSRLSDSTEHFCLLNTDEAAAQTVLGVDRKLSAANGDAVALGSTTRTVTQSEDRLLSGDAGAASLTVTVGLTNAHSGTAPTQGIIVGLTRAVRVKSVSATFMAYCSMGTGCTVDCDWVGFSLLGGSALAGKHGVEWNGTAGSVNFSKCAWRDMDTHGFWASATGGVGDFTVADCVFYKFAATAGGSAISVQEATPNTWTIARNVVIGINTSATGLDINDLGGTLIDNWVSSCQNGAVLNEATGNVCGKISGTISGNTFQSLGSIGINIQALGGGRISNTTIWRATSQGIGFTSGSLCVDLLIDTAMIFGCATGIQGQLEVNELTLRNCTVAGDTTFPSSIGLALSTNLFRSRVRLEGCDFGTVTGIRTAHTSADIALPSQYGAPQLTLINTILASATEISSVAQVSGRGYIAYQRDEGLAGDHRKHYPALGTVSIDSVTVRTSPRSEKLEPTGAFSAVRLESSPKRVAVGNGQSCAISAWVNKGATYNGSAPRLRVKHNSAAGITEATVASHAGAAGSFLQVNGTVGPVTENCTLEFCVDVDGTLGQVNVADWSASVS
jgi:hypothetical protein